MKKKCLGCGKAFEDTMSICQDCFQAIERVRDSINVLPQRVRKKSWMFFRITALVSIYILSAIWVLLMSWPMMIFSFGGISNKKSTLFSAIGHQVFISLFGFVIGRILWNKFEAPLLIRRWLTREWHQHIRRQDWLATITGFLRYAFAIFVPLLGIDFAGHYFLTPVIAGLWFLSYWIGFSIGLYGAVYLSTDWMKKLSK